MKEFMKLALKEAEKAFDKGEVPIGAIIVKNEKVIAKAHNQKENLKDPTAHAEILVIREAAKILGTWRLAGCELYVTIEPCPMCAGAVVQSRIQRLVIGAMEPKFGGAGSIFNIVNHPKLNHKIEVIEGTLEEECLQLMQDFFKRLRQKRKKK
ncbi:tRNA adenosine(34) deaminase TadA [Garciella nitratireducens]|uniref:tRNA-specific adenosine deaminase n=1 Tax=Garciella nitratireducens DSM 15102 TaxID=1121911 RepID=A0A1T4NJ30_9FIRM|nr:tRNA adenosine(34) deaminase TadA [Garciella nitratireducens]RBP37984.1 tRNA(adenine34) deaminase [Garciella nitratireducens]SJZ79056.1 tRNA(adenine34) deaminase [Garciella nitratireducens DSM 15102]